MREILRLPTEFVAGPESKIIIPSQEINRLSIAGLLDLYNIQQNGMRRWPTPLLLVDGRPAEKDLALSDGYRRYFYGPLNDLANWSDNPPVVLNSTNWAFGVDISNDPTRNPSSYLGHGIDPDEAVAIIFEEPIPYEQVAFEAVANTWRTVLRETRQ